MAALTPSDIATLQAMEALIARLLADATPAPEPPPEPLRPPSMAWGAKVSETFRARVRYICDHLFPYPDAPSDLMTCIAWESGRTFSPSKKNLAGSGATGLIQFMPATAEALGTTTAALERMTAEDQLNYVYKYFRPYAGRIRNLSDMYMAILWPAAVGQPDDYELWNKATKPTTYRQNAGLDTNRDGSIIKAETAAKLYALKAEGQRLAA